MPLTVSPATPILGAEISNVDLSKPLEDALFREINDALVQHSVIVIRDQNLTPVSLINFSKRFGPLMIHVLKDALLDNYPEIYRLSNKKKNGNPNNSTNCKR